MAVTFRFNTAACISKIVATGRMTERDAQQLLEDVANRAETMRKSGVPDSYVKAAGELAKKALQDAKNRSADAVANAATRAQGVAKVLSQGPENWAHNTRAILVTENGANKENIANFAGAKMNEAKGVLFHELDQAGLRKYTASESALEDIAEAMWDVRQGLASTTPSALARGPAYEAGKSIMRVLETGRRTLNGLNARIAEAIDFAFHTSHNLELMRGGGRGRPTALTEQDAFDAWYAHTRSLLNADKTFEDLTPRAGETQAQAEERFSRAAFMSMYTGSHGGIRDPGFNFEGSPNLAKKISQGRVFFFKDGKSWAQYMKVYGRQLNALELALDTIHAQASAAGNLKFLGTNPKANMDAIVDHVIKTHKDTHGDMVRKYEEDLRGNRLVFKPSLDDLMYQVGAIPRDPITALERHITSVLQVVNMDTLGSVGITHATSLLTTFNLAGRSIGLNSFQSMGGLIKAMMPLTKDRAATLSEAGALYEGAIPRNTYDNGVTIPGVISSMHSAFMTATGIRYIMRHAKQGFVWMLSNHLVNQSTKFFRELHPMLQQSFRDFGIDSNKWDLIRTMAKTEGSGGRYYIAPSSALHLDEVRVQSILGPAATPVDIWRYKQEIADQLQMFYSRMGDLSTVTPGPREFALLRGKGRGGDISSLFTQFAAWPLAAQHQLLAKTFYESQSKGSATWALGVATGLAMLSGYGRMAIRDMVAGKPPETPKTPLQTALLGLRSITAGGMLGILGDHLLGNIGKAYQDHKAIELAGPIISDINTGLSIIYKKLAAATTTGAKYDPWPDTVHLVAHNIPFANLFYAKGAFDYLVFYHLFEAVQPGWWERTNQARLRRGEGAMKGYMPGAPIPYSPLTPIGIY